MRFFYEGLTIDNKKITEAKATPILDTLFAANMARLRLAQLRVPSFTLTTALSRVIKAFQNPIWAEQARERLKQIKSLTEVIKYKAI